MGAALRVAVVVVVLVLLARAAAGAWRNRRVAVAVWRRVRLGHVVGSLGLVVVVVATAVGIMAALPVTGFGLGSLIGLSGNAVFAPLDEAARRGALGGGAPAAVDWALVLVVTGFLVGLLTLFPWLAYVEERTFREGLEEATFAQELWAALRFGLAHLIMLIPLAAALAIALAGFVYGRVYRRAYRRAAGRRQALPGPLGPPVVVAPSRWQMRAEAVLASTVWHTTFNSLVVGIVLAGFLVEAL
ncbi:MAG TPA: hypothetical protein VG452_06965 [Egibacteraceae bacterium]|nr:hypothetical protein [Egibacteraceae bacterium]